jgi:hypothetical protein
MSEDRNLPVHQVLEHLALTTKQMDAAGEGLDCIVLLMVDKSGGWAGAVGGPKAADLPKILLNSRDSLLRGENSFTLFVRREEEHLPGEHIPLPPRMNGSVPQPLNDDADED